MKEKKSDKWLLYGIGFLTGRAVVLGMNPFIIPVFLAAYSIRQSSLVLVGVMFGGALSAFIPGSFWIQNGDYLFRDITISPGSFVMKYLLILMFSAFLVRIVPKRQKSKFYAGIAMIVCLLSFAFGYTVYGPGFSVLMALFETIITICCIPGTGRGLKLLVRGISSREKYNEEMLSVILLTAICLWGIPITLFHTVTLLETVGLYIIIYTIHRFGAGYGVGIAGISGVILAIHTKQPEYVGAVFIIAIALLAGSILFEKRKIGSLFGFAVGVSVAGLTYFDYFFTADGLKSAVSSLLLFAATPAFLLNIRIQGSGNMHSTQTAAEMNRITAEKIRDLSGAFKRIEYTLAGCGPAETRVSLGQIGELIGRFSENLESVEPIAGSHEALLRSRLSEQGVVMGHLTAVRNERNHKQYYVSARGRGRKIMLTKDAAAIMSEIFHENIRAASNTPAIISETEKVLTFEESAGFKCFYQVRRVKKYGSNVSGDNFSVKENEDGKLFMMISDGMGSGSLASCESCLMIDTMEEMMEAGFDPLYGISFSNECMTSKNNGRTFTTFDMGVIDLYQGTIEIYKQGAAASFIVHQKEAEKEVKIIRGTTLPIGILEKTECDIDRDELHDGDIVVMASDGIFSNVEQDFGEEDMAQLLKKVDSNNCKEIMNQIMQELLYRNQGRFMDDATIIVVYVTETRNTDERQDIK